jgi:hypothetical protein
MTAREQRKKIIELLTECYAVGVNSKLFYNKEYYNYKERMRELRKDGWVFAKFKQPLNGHNFDRFFIAYNPFTKEVNSSIPTCATYWNDKGRLPVHEVKYLKTGTAEKKVVRWEFNNITNIAVPIYA